MGTVASVHNGIGQKFSDDPTKGKRKIVPNGDFSEAKVQRDPLINGGAPDQSISNGEERDRLNNDESNKKNRKEEHKNRDLYREDTSGSDTDSTQLATSLMHRVGTQLPAILRGRVDPARLMWEDETFKRFNADFEGNSRLYAAVATYIQKLAFQSPSLRILELGAHNTLTTAQILEGIATRLQTSSGSVQYEIIGESADVAAKLGPWLHFVKQRKSGPNLSALSLTSESNSYDVIILVNNAKSQRPKELANIRLKTGGKLIIFQNRHDRDTASLLPLVTLPGWWAEHEDDCNRCENGKAINSALVVVVLI